MNGSGENEEQDVKRSPVEHLLVYLPFALVAIGGALGGAAGGVGVAINLKTMKSDLSAGKRYGLYFATLIGAALFYFIVVVILVMLFPDFFNQT